ncbi:lipopolysaccharide-induced tumor necrosis factor-alpha factor homolog isoform X2 [Gouania willdenowi]|uniref:lipopolysaccharide-induced tumor necrosis factor-alpha factor homolog isoform X2 n=1 Tax=Gouania willdenowi TaxID=441366 RepID=UPI001056D144|nr:lipopolysaccharide-induced tumor necrosis factor-alpha factor homolog isoform X2 [Gouania willdenowi]
MEKPNPAHESAPPYPDPPMVYGGPVPGPGMYSQPGPYPGATPPPGYQEVPPPGMYPHPGFTAGPPPHAGYQGVPQPGMYPQPGYSPGPPPPAGYQGVACILRDLPGNMVCPYCQQTVLTNTTTTPGILTWFACLALAIVGCFFCCWIPFLIDSCLDVEHRCPTCQRVIHIYRRNESYAYGRRGVVTTAYV